MTKVIIDVIHERDKQDLQWGGPSMNLHQSAGPCLSSWDVSRWSRLRKVEIISATVFVKIAALCFAAIESYDRMKSRVKI